MDTKEFKGVIEDIVDARMSKKGIAKFVSAVVKTVNSNGSVDVYLPPDTEKIVSGVLNKTGERLSVGASVELCTKNGKLSNAWVSEKHGTNFNVDKKITDLELNNVSPPRLLVEFSNGYLVEETEDKAYKINEETGYVECVVPVLNNDTFQLNEEGKLEVILSE